MTAHADSFQPDPFDIFAGVRAERVTGIVLPSRHQTNLVPKARPRERNYHLPKHYLPAFARLQVKHTVPGPTGGRVPLRLERDAGAAQCRLRGCEGERRQAAVGFVLLARHGIHRTSKRDPVAFRILVPRNPPCSQAPGRCVEGVLQGRGGPSALQVDIRNDPVIHHSRHGPHQRRHDHRSEDRPHAHSPEGREPVPRRQAGESRGQEDRGQVVRHRLLRGRGGGAVRQRDPCRRGHECRPGCGCDVCGRGRDHPRPRYRRSRYENRAQPAGAASAGLHANARDRGAA